MSFLKKLFGGGESNGPAEVEPTEYNGFSIYPEPIKEGAVFRLAARIEKDIEGERRSQSLVRADTLNSADAASDAAIRKAQQVIDERGDKLFEGPSA